MSDLRYPIGKFQWTEPATEEQRAKARAAYIAVLAELPRNMRTAVMDLRAEQLDTPYRPEGWTVRQVAHHVPDSHMNAYIRFKLALTESEPTVKPYDEKLWAETPEMQSTPPEASLALLENLHLRWVKLLCALQPEQWKRMFRHPELGEVPLEKNLALYAWHGRHHVAHITELRKRMGW